MQKTAHAMVPYPGSRTDSAIRKRTETLRTVLDKAEPGLLSVLSETGYRDNACGERAVEAAVQTVRKRYGTRGDMLEAAFSIGGAEAETRSYAAKLTILNSDRAADSFASALHDRRPEMRRIAAEGLADVALVSDSPEEANRALDTLACAANRGMPEAASEIDARLREFFNVRVRQDISLVVARAAASLGSPGLKLAAMTAGAMAFMEGAGIAGIALCAATVTVHAIRKRLGLAG